MDSSIASRPQLASQNLLTSLPAEIRNVILEYVFESRSGIDGFSDHGIFGGLSADETYSSSRVLQPLLICRQLYHDAGLLALSRTNFVITNLFANIPEKLARLQPRQIEAIRSISFVADTRHFRKLGDWREWPLGMQSLNLDTLTIILHRASYWHYLFDFTADLVALLRQLSGVQRLVFVRNGARVKGSFKTWYNRLVNLIMKHDYHNRYERCPAVPEKTWWAWSYDEMAQRICLQALPARPLVEKDVYLQQMQPLAEALKISVQSEEWNPDPRARTMYY